MIKPELNLNQKALIAVLACATLPVLPAVAGGERGVSYSSYSTIVEQEYIKRQERVRQAYELERDGDRLYAKQDYAGAIDRYRTALNTMPAGSSNQADRQRIIGKFSRAAV